VFAGEFTLEAASAVASSSGLAEVEVDDGIVNLVAKSLISADIGGDIVRYRLLDTTVPMPTRNLWQPVNSRPSLSAMPSTIALYWSAPSRDRDTSHRRMVVPSWLVHRQHPRGAGLGVLAERRRPIGVALTAASVPLWSWHSLLVECRGRVERALARVQPGSNLDARHAMRLHAALGWALIPTRGPLPETRACLGEGA